MNKSVAGISAEVYGTVREEHPKSLKHIRLSNPFENAAPNGVTDIDAEDLIQPGDDKPGEGIH